MAGQLQKRVSFLSMFVLSGVFLPVFVVYIEENLSIVLAVLLCLALIYQLYDTSLEFVRSGVVLIIYNFKNLYFSIYPSLHFSILLWHAFPSNFIKVPETLSFHKSFIVLNKVQEPLANITQKLCIFASSYLLYTQWLTLGQMDICKTARSMLDLSPFFRNFNLLFVYLLV